MKKVLCILSVLSLLPVSGCYQRREINTLPIVMGFGIDAAESSTEFISQIAIPSNIVSSGSTASSSGEGKSSYVNISSEGDYTFPSLRSSATMLGEKLYMAHNLLVVFGQDIAEAGISPYMDFFLRDHELRLNMYTLVADGKASDILSSDSDFHSIPAIHITKLVEALDGTALGVNRNAFDFFSCMSSGKRSALMPLIHITKNQEKGTLKIDGTAVFSGDVMVGTLDTYQTRGYLWATNNVKNSIVTASVYGSPVSVEVLQAKGTIATSAENDRLIVDIKVTIDGNIGSVQGEGNFSSLGLVYQLQEAVSENVKQEILSAVTMSQKLNSDFFGFEESLYKHDYKAWKRLEPEWDSVLQNLSVNISVDTNILESGRIQREIGG